MTHAAAALERVTKADRFRDYCLWDYEPLTSPLGKLNSANLLWRAIEVSDQGPELAEALRRLRDGLGSFQTVYGVKKFGDKLSFEFYFYDYQRLERRLSIPRVVDILAPLTSHPLDLLERRPYFMFSLDIDADIAARRKPLDIVNVYVGNPGSSVSSGVCYEFSPAGLRLANFYFFFNRRKEWEDIVAKTSCSAHHDLLGLPIRKILRPELLDCEIVVVANKKLNDGVYFSRLGVDPLIGFLRDERFPVTLTDFVRAHRDELAHMLYDVGIDYRVEGGEVRVLKSAFYGLL
jgi:hypothetical protein